MTLKEKYFNQAGKLEKVYPNLKFRNHCYWRIALDNTLAAKWDTVIERPAYANLTEQQLTQVVGLLEAYENDERLLHVHNQNSIALRKNFLR
ncbi:MAG: acetyltransferase [Bacteroidota bacterium]